MTAPGPYSRLASCHDNLGGTDPSALFAEYQTLRDEALRLLDTTDGAAGGDQSAGRAIARAQVLMTGATAAAVLVGGRAVTGR